jgi:hypothetical protein
LALPPRLPLQSMSSKELEAVVSDVIAELGLESVRDT